MNLAGSRMNPKKFSASQIKFYIILIPLAIVMLFPLIYIINHAFKPLDELFAFPPEFFVKKPTFNNFTQLFKAGSSTIIPMSVYLINSIIVTALTIILNLFITVFAAYALSKRKSKFTERLVGINQTALMFCGTVVAIPTYLVISKIGLINSFFANILPLIAMPVGLFLVKQFMDQIPNDLIEAARVEGAGEVSIIRKVIMPIVKPSLATVAILTFQSVWNNTSTSSLYITNEKLKTFAYYLNTLTMTTAGNTVVGVGMQAAATVIIFLPNLIIFLILQSQMMSTMAYSGIK